MNTLLGFIIGFACVLYIVPHLGMVTGIIFFGVGTPLLLAAID